MATIMSQEPTFLNLPQTSETPPAAEDRVVFTTVADAAAYLDWKRNVAAPIRAIVERAIKQTPADQPATGLALTDEFLSSLAASVAAGSAQFSASTPQIVKNLLAPLGQVKLSETDFLNIFERLADPNTSWQLRKNMYDQQIAPALEWVIKKDTKNARERLLEQEALEKIEEENSSEQEPNEADDELETSSADENAMSSMEAEDEEENSAEGKPLRAKFTVSPYRGGRFKQKVFHKFDLAQCKWIPHAKTFTPAHGVPLDAMSTRIMSGKVGGFQRLALPLPENFSFDAHSLQTDVAAKNVVLTQDENNIWYLQINAPGEHTFTLQLARGQREIASAWPADLEMSGDLPAELQAKIKELRASRQPEMKQARALVRFVREHLKYSNSKTAWDAYTAQPENFFQALWQGKEADCYVSNTLAVRALQELGVRAQFAGGFMVKEKNKNGDAVLHKKNGHAWLEVWDHLGGNLITLDATPAGDPNVDEEQQEKELSDEPSDEEKDDSDDEMMSEEEAEKQLEELEKKEKEKQPPKPKTPHDRQAEVFAGLADCSPAQAKEFFTALERVRAIKDTDGVPISEKLINEWRKLIETRIIETHNYRGPVRMSEGDRLEDPTAAYIDIRSGDFDPGGFEKFTQVEERQQTFGGICLYLSFDLSGSMAGVDGASGSSKAVVQRDVALLFIDSIMQCAYLTNQHAAEMSPEMPIKIMATLAASSGMPILPLTNKWGPKEQWAIYSALTRLAGGSTPTHKTLDLIEETYLAEKLKAMASGVPAEQWPLNYTMVITDGEPDDAAATEAVRQRLVNAGMITRTYPVGGSSASPDAAPPLASFSELPPQLAHDILEEFKKLHPNRVQA